MRVSRPDGASRVAHGGRRKGKGSARHTSNELWDTTARAGRENEEPRWEKDYDENTCDPISFVSHDPDDLAIV